MISKRVSAAIMSIKQQYSSKGISYPRVDNDYNKDRGYIMYPHPKLENSLPLKKKEYEYEKKTALLELSNNQLISPSFLGRAGKNSITSLIDEIFNNDMSIKKRKLEKITKLVNSFETFLNGFEVTESKLDEMLKIEKKQRECIVSKQDTIEELLEKSMIIQESKERMVSSEITEKRELLSQIGRTI